ncbi:MAG: PA14 domain-containing protein [Janthinobacterium lividum]
MTRYGWCFLGGILAAAPTTGQAQTLAGDGLKAEYYAGHDFEKLVLTRRDPAIDFNWHQREPVAGVPAEDFSVRWTGWLVPPTTGHYVLHISVDDGMRLWLDGRQLLNDWRGQPLSFYQLEVELQAGRAYTLRIDYSQYSADSRALVAWERPAQAPPPSWRNMWGRVSPAPLTETVPMRYLFTKKPTTPPPPPVAPTPPVAPPVVVAPPPAPAATPPPARVVRHSAAAYVASVTRPVPAPPTVAPKPTIQPPAAAVRTATRLAEGRAVTLRALYFEQGKADLLPAVQASLDTLASALALRPSLRLEVQGHTDNQGDSAINRQLSQRRADVVCQYLAAHGIAAARLRPVGYGGTRPIADNRQAGLRPRNRRVVLVGL